MEVFMRTFFLALFSFSMIASATSIKTDRISVTRTHNDETRAYVSIFVDSTGEIRLVTGSKVHNSPVVRTVGHVTSKELESINELIKKARAGEYITKSAKCFVAPHFITDYFAVNGTVILSKGDICYSVKRNTSEAARDLMGLLNELLNKYAPRNFKKN
jgi:hypothetical protein